MGFDAAVGYTMRKIKGPLAEEFSKTLNEIRLGKPRLEALEDLGNRTGVDDLKTFITAVVHASRLGGSITNTLRIQADSIRTRRRQRAQEQAMKAPIKIVFPLVLFIFPALFIVSARPRAGQRVATNWGSRRRRSGLSWFWSTPPRKRLSPTSAISPIRCSNAWSGCSTAGDLSKGEGLLLDRCYGIHTFGMRFPIDVLFLDKDLRVIRAVKALPPYRTCVVKKSVYVLEVPVGALDASRTAEGDQIQIRTANNDTTTSARVAASEQISSGLVSRSSARRGPR